MDTLPDDVLAVERCEQCGFRHDSTPPPAVPGLLRALPPRYTVALRAAEREGLARERPRPQTWSPLEYAGHVRYVFQVQRERLELALTEDTPALALMRRDEHAVEQRYNAQPVDAVLEGLAVAAERLADRVGRLRDDEWHRTAIYPYPEPTERTMTWLARNALHEGVHHLDDITTGMDTLRTRRAPP